MSLWRKSASHHLLCGSYQDLPSPFNLIELCILPFEFCLSKERYYRLNAFVLTIIFSPALVIIALFESKIDRFKVKAAENAQLEDGDDLDEDVSMLQFWSAILTDHYIQPEADECDKEYGTLSKIKFDDLIKTFPCVHHDLGARS